MIKIQTVNLFRVRLIERIPGVGIHGIEVRDPSFLRRFTIKLSNTY